MVTTEAALTAAEVTMLPPVTLPDANYRCTALPQLWR
jgi:hypothetical protein